MEAKTFEKVVRYISQDNKIIIREYINRVKKSSIKSARMQKSVIERCIQFIKKPVSEIQRQDILDFVDQKIENQTTKDGKLFSFSTKRNYCGYLRMFFRQMVFKKLITDNPVPYTRDLIDMGYITSVKNNTENVNPFEKEDKRIEEDVFTKEEIFEILKTSKAKNSTDFVIFGLLISSGARISEILTLRTINIDFNKSMIYTGVENGAMKSTYKKRKRINKGELLGIFYGFPEKFGYYIKQYIQSRQRKGNEFLFQSTKFDEDRNEYNHYSHNTFYVRVCKRYGKKYARFHKFRTTLITLRRKELKTPLEISQMLVNHSTKDVHTSFYTKYSLEDRKEFYNSYFPYKQIPYF